MNTRFSYESDMIEPIISNAPQYTETKKPWHVFVECVAFAGIADIVFAEFDENIIQDRINSDLFPLVKIAHILTMMALDDKNPTTLEQVQNFTGYTRPYIKKGLSYLINNNFVLETDDGFIKSSSFKPVIKKIVAIEVKKNDWTKGIAQASRYLRFANRAFLVIDKSYVRRISDNIKYFSTQRIGLSLINANDCRADIFYNPGWQPPKSMTEYTLMAERLWSIIIKNSDYTLGQHYDNII